MSAADYCARCGWPLTHHRISLDGPRCPYQRKRRGPGQTFMANSNQPATGEKNG